MALHVFSTHHPLHHFCVALLSPTLSASFMQAPRQLNTSPSNLLHLELHGCPWQAPISAPNDTDQRTHDFSNSSSPHMTFTQVPMQLQAAAPFLHLPFYASQLPPAFVTCPVAHLLVASSSTALCQLSKPTDKPPTRHSSPGNQLTSRPFYT